MEYRIPFSLTHTVISSSVDTEHLPCARCQNRYPRYCPQGAQSLVWGHTCKLTAATEETVHRHRGKALLQEVKKGFNGLNLKGPRKTVAGRMQQRKGT